MEAKFRIIKTIFHIEESLWVYKNDILLVSIDNPDDEIWIKILSLEESNSLFTEISEEIELFSSKEFGISLIVFLHLKYEFSLSLVERNRGNYGQIRRKAFSKSKKRAIEMSIKV